MASTHVSKATTAHSHVAATSATHLHISATSHEVTTAASCAIYDCWADVPFVIIVLVEMATSALITSSAFVAPSKRFVVTKAAVNGGTSEVTTFASHSS